MSERECYVGFSVFPGIGPLRFNLLLQAFGSAQAAWQASRSQLLSSGLSERLVDHFIPFKQSFSIEQYKSRLQQKNIHIICRDDASYPAKLKQLPDAPIVLYMIGDNSELLCQDKLISIVGTRKMNDYGLQVTKQLTSSLVTNGWGIVSGLALGVDGVAHRTALECGGKTIAVLGCGVDVIAPASHRELYNSIISHGGVIISEMPIGHRPLRGLFPARNRIISGLSWGVVVTQGAKDSGALITARNAGEQGREVFAVPGSIFSDLSGGVHQLIANGATILQSIQDIESSYEPQYHHNSPQINFHNFSEDEKRLIQILQESPCDMDMLNQKLSFRTALLSGLLTKLELDAVIERDLQGVYHVIR